MARVTATSAAIVANTITAAAHVAAARLRRATVDPAGEGTAGLPHIPAGVVRPRFGGARPVEVLRVVTVIGGAGEPDVHHDDADVVFGAVAASDDRRRKRAAIAIQRHSVIVEANV